MIPSPTYTVKRTSEELYQDDQPYQNSRFAPSTVENIGIHREEMPLNRRYADPLVSVADRALLMFS